MGVSLQYATLAQIAGELRRRANRERAKLTGDSTGIFHHAYYHDLPKHLDEIANELQEMDER